MALSTKAQPGRRIWIPKPGTSDLRPLGIPTMLDRANQALGTMVIELAWAAGFALHSYGWRPGRGGWDAIEALHDGRQPQPQWSLDAEITGGFAHLPHQALLHQLPAPPRLHRGIQAWLRAGAIDKDGFHPADAGPPRWGPLSLGNVHL